MSDVSVQAQQQPQIAQRDQELVAGKTIATAHESEFIIRKDNKAFGSGGQQLPFGGSRYRTGFRPTLFSMIRNAQKELK